MNVARSAGEVLAEHTTLELECIDRMYLKVYVPMLQAGAGAAWFFRKVRGNPVASSASMAPMTNGFVAGLKRFAADHHIDVVRFERHERKDDRTRAYLRNFEGDDVHRCGAGEGARGAYRAPQRPAARPVPVAGVVDGDGEPLLRLPRR